MADLAIGVLYSARPWRGALQRYVRDHVAGVTLRLVRDTRMLHEEEVHIVVLDDETSSLTPAFVAALRERGVKVAGVYDPAEAGPEGPALLTRLGVDAAIPSTLASEEMFARLAELTPEARVDDRFHELVASLDLASEDASDNRAPSQSEGLRERAAARSPWHSQRSPAARYRRSWSTSTRCIPASLAASAWRCTRTC